MTNMYQLIIGNDFACFHNCPLYCFLYKLKILKYKLIYFILHSIHDL